MEKEILNNGETPNHSHHTQIVKIGNIIIETLRSKKAPNGDFLPANAIDSQGKRLWDFKGENFDGFGKLIEFQGEYFIYLEDRQRVIHRVIPVADLPKIQRITLGDQIMTLGGRDTYELYELKVAIANFLCTTFVTTEQEQELLSAMAKLHQAELEKERLQKQEEREAKERAKVQQITNIMARGKITAYTDDGKKRFGIPVIDSEWEMLPNDTAVVVVNNLEEKIPDEAFFVKKTSSGRISKGSPVKVFSERKNTEKAHKEDPAVEASGIIRVIINDKLQQILTFSKENFKLLRTLCLEEKTKVAVGEPKNEKYTVVELIENEWKTVGEFATV